MTKYFWISVGGGEPEIAIVDENKQIAYTIGCPDGLPADKFQLMRRLIDPGPPKPKTPQEEAEFAAWLAKEEKAGRRHGYRRF